MISREAALPEGLEGRGVHAVTGAFGYTGRYIARRLIAQAKPVRTLTGHPARSDMPIEIAPLAFNDPEVLAASLEGVEVLYNTYWVRFARGPVTFERAVENSLRLFDTAKRAGVRRLVHVSITNPDSSSVLPYFRGKGKLEEAIHASGLSYAILRPTVIFGPEDILLNNIAWFLRHFPFFPVPGSGDFPVQPV